MEADIFSLLDPARAPAPETERSEQVIAEACSEPATVEIEGELAQAAALLAIRFLLSGLGRRLIHPNGNIRDADVLDLVGINLDDVSEASRKREIFHQGMAIQRAWLESQPRPLIDCVDRNLVEIGTRLALPPAALEVLRMGVLTHHVPGLMDIWRLTRRNCLEEFAQMSSRALELPMIEVRQALSRSSSLRRAGLLHSIMCWDDPSSCLAMDPAVADVIASENMDTQALLNAVVRPSDPPKLGLGDFGHLACEVETATTYLQNAVRLGKRGVNILLHGEPGVGKTELAKVLAAATSLHLHEVPTEDRDGDSLGKTQRLGSFMTCQRLLADGERQAILFDEIEDVFPVEGQAATHMSHISNDVPKGYFNHLLETTPVPTFWISNAIFQIDPAFIRSALGILRTTEAKLATSTEIAERRQRIVETIAAWGGRGPTISELQDYLSRDLSLSTRHVEREIRTLAGMGLVGKDGDCWRVLDLDDFDRLSSEYAACLVTKIAATTLDFALPADLQRQIRRFVARSDARLNRAFVNHPAKRWQQALKIIPASSHLDIPFVNADVRDAIEQAILERRQVILKYSSEVTYRASISHLLLRLPNSATILTWEPGADDAVPIEYQLVELESVEVLEDAASWPMDFNIDSYIDDFGKRSPYSALNWQIELLVDPILVHHWDRRMVKKSINVGELDVGSGRVHVTIDEEPNHELIEWLWGYAALLEVRSPVHLREQFVERARNAARAYSDDPDPFSTLPTA